MEAGTEGDQVGIVGGGDDGDGAGAAGKGEAHVVGEDLEGIRSKLVIIIDDVVVGGTAGPLETGMGAQVKVELGRVADTGVNDRTRRDIPRAIRILLLGGDEAGVVALLDEDHGDGRCIVGVDFLGTGLDLCQLEFEDLLELALRDTIAIEEDALGTDLVEALEGLHVLLEHLLYLHDQLLTGVLNTHRGGIAGELDVHAGNHCSNRWLLRVPNAWMGDIRTEDHGRLLMDEGHLLSQVGVGPATLDVDLEGEIGAVLLVGTTEMLDLHALGGQPDGRIRAPLDFAIQVGIGGGQDDEDELGGLAELLLCLPQRLA